ncbi:MAG TPA: hypothetical protein VHD83_21260 [Puia sp.]|nr:hypothetical protein [Puia sp.]
MKQLLAFLLLLPAISFAQKINPDSLSFVYSGVGQVNMPARILQSRARLYIQDLSGASVRTKVDDLDGNVLLFEITLPLAYKESPGVIDSSYLGNLVFAVKIICKDGRYKYSCYQVSQQGAGTNIATGGWLSNVKPICGTFFISLGKWRAAKLSAHQYILNCIAGLQTAMNSNEIDPDNPDF